MINQWLYKITKKFNHKYKNLLMGLCYSEEQQWFTTNENYRNRRKKRKDKKHNSIIYEERTIYQQSFNSAIIQSFRDNPSIVNTLFPDGNVEIGSVVELSEKDQEALQKSLQTFNTSSQRHQETEVFTLCNLKTKSFLHTHKIKLPNQNKQHQVSCCPFSSTHIVQYDLWKLVKSQQLDRFYIYHPFTQRFLNIKKGQVVCSQQKKQWQIHSFGVRRNGGYLKIRCEEGQLCMTSDRALLQGHRKLIICNEKHISHLWQLKFGNIIDLQNQD